jgi:hypothetical protein
MYSRSLEPLIPYFLGHFAIYASSLYTAREIYDKISNGSGDAVSGTESTFSGERINWSLLKKRSGRNNPVNVHGAGH